MIVITSMIELESLFGHLFDELSNGENQVVSKPSAVTTVDASDKRQQQQDSTSSTLTLATTITADGIFDFPTQFLEELQNNQSETLLVITVMKKEILLESTQTADYSCEILNESKLCQLDIAFGPV
ncbi:hypothetical protein Tco_1407216 [Tanacetum coccineum]